MDFFILDSGVLIMPFAGMIAVILIILSFTMKDNKVFKVIRNIIFSIIFLYFICFIGMVIPLTFVSAISNTTGYENGILLLPCVVVIAILLISLIIRLRNRWIILDNNEREIYVRDIEVPYSPAVLSYLMNNKIETRKDLPATILNLVTNNIIKIEKNEDDKIKIIDLKNQIEIEKLSLDEKYAYKMLTTEVTKNKIRTWKSKVKEEYEKYKFSKNNEINVGNFLIYTYMVMLLLGVIYFSINKNADPNLFIQLVFTTFFASIPASIFIGIKEIISKKNGFIDTYTKKGAIEYNRWKKFEKFIEDYTLIKDKSFESIIILGKYLSYSIALGINQKCDDEIYREINITYSFNYNILEEQINKVLEEEESRG